MSAAFDVASGAFAFKSFDATRGSRRTFFALTTGAAPDAVVAAGFTGSSIIAPTPPARAFAAFGFAIACVAPCRRAPRPALCSVDRRFHRIQRTPRLDRCLKTRTETDDEISGRHFRRAERTSAAATRGWPRRRRAKSTGETFD
eukprot:31176-Pelagococcus_subviridis.AAC.68